MFRNLIWFDGWSVLIVSIFFCWCRKFMIHKFLHFGVDCKNFGKQPKTLFEIEFHSFHLVESHWNLWFWHFLMISKVTNAKYQITYFNERDRQWISKSANDDNNGLSDFITQLDLIELKFFHPLWVLHHVQHWSLLRTTLNIDLRKFEKIVECLMLMITKRFSSSWVVESDTRDIRSLMNF